MIILKNKDFEINSLHPDTDWYNAGNIVIDETTDEGRILAEKVMQCAPYFDFVLDVNGKLIDITPTEHPPEPPPEPTELELLQQENALLKAQNKALSERADFIEDVVAEMALQVYR